LPNKDFANNLTIGVEIKMTGPFPIISVNQLDCPIQLSVPDGGMFINSAKALKSRY